MPRYPYMVAVCADREESPRLASLGLVLTQAAFGVRNRAFMFGGLPDLIKTAWRNVIVPNQEVQDALEKSGLTYFSETLSHTDYSNQQVTRCKCIICKYRRNEEGYASGMAQE